jgi:hypothetical protein
MAAFWVVAPSSLVEVYDVSEVLTASITRALIAVSTSETSTRLRGATTQKATIFVLAALST